MNENCQRCQGTPVHPPLPQFLPEALEAENVRLYETIERIMAKIKANEGALEAFKRLDAATVDAISKPFFMA